VFSDGGAADRRLPTNSSKVAIRVPKGDAFRLSDCPASAGLFFPAAMEIIERRSRT
jgi:hypothetical protein